MVNVLGQPAVVLPLLLVCLVPWPILFNVGCKEAAKVQYSI